MSQSDREQKLKPPKSLVLPSVGSVADPAGRAALEALIRVIEELNRRILELEAKV